MSGLSLLKASRIVMNVAIILLFLPFVINGSVGLTSYLTRYIGSKFFYSLGFVYFDRKSRNSLVKTVLLFSFMSFFSTTKKYQILFSKVRLS